MAEENEYHYLPKDEEDRRIEDILNHYLRIVALTRMQMDKDTRGKGWDYFFNGMTEKDYEDFEHYAG